MAFENLGGQLLSLDQLSNPFGAMQAGEQDANALALQQQQVQQGQVAAQQQQAAVAQSQAQAVDMQHFLANPTPEAGAAIQAKYKNDFSGFKSMWDQRDKSAQTADLTNLGSVVSAINAGSPDVAAKLVADRVAANTAAGVQQPGVAALNDALQSGNTKLAKGLASAMILAATGDPEKLATLGDSANKPVTLGKDSKLVDPVTGKVIADNSSADYKTIKGADGAEHLVKIGGDDAGGPTVGAGGFAKIYSEFTAPTEGGYANNDGGTGAPVNYGVNQHANPDVDVKSLTPTAAAGILHDRYWAPLGLDNVSDPKMQAVAFDTAVNMGVGTAKAMMKASGGDVDKMLQFRQQRYNAIGGPNLSNWMARNAKLQAYVGGGDDSSDVTDVTPASLKAADADPSLSIKQGDISTVPAAQQSIVKALADGRMELPSSFALTKPYWQNVLAATSAYDPTFDAANVKTRVATRKDFTSGKAAATITSFNTALGHIDQGIKDADALNNSSFPAWNGITNFAANATGDPRVKNFNATKIALTGELAKAFKGGVGTQAEVDDLASQLDASGSPAQLHGVLGKFANLLQSKIAALGEQYTAGMGRSSDKINLLDTHAKRTLASLGIGPDGQSTAPAAPAAPTNAAPVKVSSRADVMALPSGTLFINPADGRTLKKH